MGIKEAKILAKQYMVGHMLSSAGDRYVIVDAATKEVGSGWYFSYQTARFVETRSIDFSVVGNLPIYVSKAGDVVEPRRPDM